MRIRPIDWERDLKVLATIDTSFSTDRILQLTRNGRKFDLAEVTVSPPLTKRLCDLADEAEMLQRMGHVMLAQENGEILGMVAANYSPWNGRVVLWHLYVQPAARGKGLGQRLLNSVLAYARERGAWAVWLEAQSVNLPAVRFYERHGFYVCGLDEALYDPKGDGGGEVAVYMAYRL